MKNAFNLETLAAMSADELEQYRDRGREYRVMLNCAVLGQLALPEGWHVVAEEGCEFCGRVPVVCRISPAGDEATALYLCSAGAEVPNWSMTLAPRSLHDRALLAGRDGVGARDVRRNGQQRRGVCARKLGGEI